VRRSAAVERAIALIAAISYTSGRLIPCRPPKGNLMNCLSFQRLRREGNRSLVLLAAAACLIGGWWPVTAVHGAPAEDPADEYGIRIARLKYPGGGDWYNGPSEVPNWLREFERRTGIKTQTDEKIVSLEDEDLRAYPFLYLTGHGTIQLTPTEIQILRDYLDSGGFLYANDDYGLDTSFRALAHQLFPEREFEELPNTHPIFHVFYDLPGLPKIHQHDGKPPQAFGVTVDGRLVLMYAYESDIGDGLDDPEVHGDPAEKRELAMKMAVNILMYAITQNALP
jgi:hypothetical protein